MERRVINKGNFKTRETQDGKKALEGYFSVFDQTYEIVPGWLETVAPGAFDRTLSDKRDVKVLWNHDTNVVLGSTANHTATLTQDSTGLKGVVEINDADSDARNAYARIARGDVTGCSFGFDIKDYEESWDADGTYRTRLTDVDLFEVSPCTFPAYEGTTISARSSAEVLENAKKKRRDAWKKNQMAKLKKSKGDI